MKELSDNLFKMPTMLGTIPAPTPLRTKDILEYLNGKKTKKLPSAKDEK